MIDTIASKEALKSSWKQLTKNKESHGVSGLTIQDFENNLEKNIDGIHKLLKEKKYQFSPTRATFIKKKDGGYRPLQVPEINDRIVLKSIAIQLEKTFEDVLEPNKKVSFAYQKGSSVKNAIEKTLEYYNQGNPILLVFQQ